MNLLLKESYIPMSNQENRYFFNSNDSSQNMNQMRSNLIGYGGIPNSIPNQLQSNQLQSNMPNNIANSLHSNQLPSNMLQNSQIPSNMSNQVPNQLQSHVPTQLQQHHLHHQLPHQLTLPNQLQSHVPNHLPNQHPNTEIPPMELNSSPLSPVQSMQSGFLTVQDPSFLQRNSYPGTSYYNSQPQLPPEPRLVRTTSLPTNKIAAAPVGFGPKIERSPRYPRVTVSFRGDLERVTQDWTDDEVSAGRRLVQFTWTQQHNSLVIGFSPIAQEAYSTSQTVISCLKWNQSPRGYPSFFVTSVDVIQLLEKLVNQKFAVEEKNRIRRNLQGLKPLTIARSKHQYQDFFQQIMKYPAPRPRNIEKDVKVFKWQVLRDAITRVLSKYSCDYSGVYGALSPMQWNYPYQQQQQQQFYTPVDSRGSMESSGSIISVTENRAQVNNLETEEEEVKKKNKYVGV